MILGSQHTTHIRERLSSSTFHGIQHCYIRGRSIDWCANAIETLRIRHNWPILQGGDDHTHTDHPHGKHTPALPIRFGFLLKDQK